MENRVKNAAIENSSKQRRKASFLSLRIVGLLLFNIKQPLM